MHHIYYKYWHQCSKSIYIGTNADVTDAGQQVKIVLLSFWSVIRWVSQWELSPLLPNFHVPKESGIYFSAAAAAATAGHQNVRKCALHTVHCSRPPPSHTALLFYFSPSPDNENREDWTGGNVPHLDFQRLWTPCNLSAAPARFRYQDHPVWMTLTNIIYGVFDSLQIGLTHPPNPVQEFQTYHPSHSLIALWCYIHL